MSAPTTTLVQVPISAVPAQMFKITLAAQTLQIALRQRATGLYADIWCVGTRVLSGVLCQDRTWLARNAATGLPGDLAFMDTQGTQNPQSTGLGTRYVLLWRSGWPA